MSGGNTSAPKAVKSGPKNHDATNHKAPERQTLSVEEAGKILGISRGAAYQYAKEGSLPTIRLGNRLLVPKAALERLLAGEILKPKKPGNQSPAPLATVAGQGEEYAA
jgi:excisionase family DNA binding protein